MKIALIVPAYQPSHTMITTLQQYCADPDCVPIVVNDGSDAAFDALFERLPAGCVCLKHDENRGKGAALKTAMRYVLDELPECDVVVTADADGQYRHEDIRRVGESARRHPLALVLGSRKFEGNVPVASRFGNAFTRSVFALATGVRLRDALTGLRGFNRCHLQAFLEISGERYDYEINMLLHAAQEGMPIQEEGVTVRLSGKSADVHFNPMRDTFKIYVRILLYVGTSLLAFSIDFIILLIMKALTATWPETVSLLASVVTARVVSATVNFIGNKRLVFHSKGNWRKEIGKFAGSTVFILAVNYALMHLLTINLDMPLVPSKLLVEITLFFVNFFIQGRFVYNNKRKD